jgi:hypothetical protein
MAKTRKGSSSKRTTRKRPLSAWNLFVKKVHKENPNATFKEVLTMASKLKKQGKMGKA